MPKPLNAGESSGGQTQTGAASRLFFVDNLRVYLTILVVLHHLMITYAGTGSWYYTEGREDLAHRRPRRLVPGHEPGVLYGALSVDLGLLCAGLLRPKRAPAVPQGPADPSGHPAGALLLGTAPSSGLSGPHRGSGRPSSSAGLPWEVLSEHCHHRRRAPLVHRNPAHLLAHLRSLASRHPAASPRAGGARGGFQRGRAVPRQCGHRRLRAAPGPGRLRGTAVCCP